MYIKLHEQPDTRYSHDNGDKNTLLQRILFTGEATQSTQNIEQDAQLSQRDRAACRVRYSFRQKYKTRTGRQYFTEIIGLSLTTVI